MTNPWYEIEVLDEESCSGESISQVVSLTLSFCNATHAGLVGVAAASDKLIESPGSSIVVTPRDLLLGLKSTLQMVWVDIFLCHSNALALAALKSDSYPEAIPLGSCAIRVCDNSYMHVYTQVKALVEAFKERYPGAVTTYASLDSFVFMN